LLLKFISLRPNLSFAWFIVQWVQKWRSGSMLCQQSGYHNG